MSVIRSIATSPKGEMTLLLLASCAVVFVLMVLAGLGGSSVVSGEHLRPMVMTVMVVALVVIGAGLLGLPVNFFDFKRATDDEVETLRRALRASEAVIQTEPQIVIFWERGERVKVLSHTLSNVAGVPRDLADIERFGQWIDSSSAGELKQALDALFASGTAFNILIRTVSGAYVEADGRASGGRAILRLRDVVGYRRDLARVLDQHRELSRECRSTRSLLNAMPMPVWMRDGHGRIAWVNDAYVRAVEARDLDEVRHSQIELLESRQRDRVRGELQEGRAYRERLALVSGGQMKAHDVVVLSLENASAGAAIDVAAIETARGELDRQMSAYDRTLHRVASGVAIFGPDRRLSFFNDAYLKIWQLDRAWLATNPSDGEILDRLRGLSRLPQVVKYREWKARVLTAPMTGEFEDWWHLLDGRTIHVMAEQRPDGGVTYLFDDVTERIALESRYNALIDAQRETLNSLKEGVAVFSPDGRVQLHNTAFAQIWRLSRTMLAEGPHVEEVIRNASSLYNDEAVWSDVRRAVTGISDRRGPTEGQMLRPDSSVIDFAATPLPGGATLVTFADVTDAKRYERALIERNDALVAADRLKSQFLSHVSYELRTPLTNIIGFGELLASPRVGALNDKQREYLGDVSSSSKTLLTIINDILDLAAIDAGGLELKLAPVAVRPIIDAAILGVRDRASRKRIDFDIKVDDSVATIFADDGRIRQILFNLLSNAIGFSSSGERIRLGCWREGQMIAFAVEDRGPGIPRDQQSKVFERFETIKQGSHHRGVGLGLAIVKSLVELHGGNLTLDSEAGRGTRVTVRLPEGGASDSGAVEKAA